MGFARKERIYRSEHISLYKLNRDDIPGNRWISQSFNHPVKGLSRATVQKMLASLKHKSQSDFNIVIERIFPDGHLENIMEDLMIGLGQLQKEESLVVITKYDEVQSVLSNPNLTSFIIWRDNSYLNMVFGQIKSDIDREDEHDPREWTRIPSINLNIKRQEIDKLVPLDFFQFKKNGAFYNRHWIQIDLSKIQSYQPKENQPSTSSTNSTTDRPTEQLTSPITKELQPDDNAVEDDTIIDKEIAPADSGKKEPPANELKAAEEENSDGGDIFDD